MMPAMTSRNLLAEAPSRVAWEPIVAWLILTSGAILFGLIATLLDRQTGNPNLAILVALAVILPVASAILWRVLEREAGEPEDNMETLRAISEASETGGYRAQVKFLAREIYKCTHIREIDPSRRAVFEVQRARLLKLVEEIRVEIEREQDSHQESTRISKMHPGQR
jgi:hypothetical protein